MKEKFVEAYKWLFGGTKKAATIAYKNNTKEYILAIIATYYSETKKSFYKD